MVDEYNHSLVHPTQVTDTSSLGGNKQNNMPASSPTMDGVHPNPSRGLPEGVVLGEDSSPSLGALSSDSVEDLASSSSQRHGSISSDRVPGSDPDETPHYLSGTSHSTSAAPHISHQVVTGPSNLQPPANQPSNLGQTHTLLDLPFPPPGIENEGEEVIFPVSSIVNSAGQQVFNSHNGSVSFFMTQGGPVATATLPPHIIPGMNTEAAPHHTSSPVHDDNGEEEEELEDHVAPIYQGYYEDIDDDYYEEIPNYHDSLIEDADLSGFDYDRLPGLPSTFDGSARSVCDDSASESNDTEKFYVTDDELSWCDPTEFPRFPLGSDLHGSTPHQDQSQNHGPGDRSERPSPTNFESVTRENLVYNPAVDNGDHLNMASSTHAESMDLHFLNPPSTLFLPFSIPILEQAQKIVYRAFEELHSSQFSPSPCATDKRELYRNPGYILLQTVANFFTQFSVFPTPSRGIFIIRGAHNALFVNGSAITFISGLDVTDAFMKSNKHTSISPHFTICQALPWLRTSASPSITAPRRRLPKATPSTPPPRPLLSAEAYYDLHEPSMESIYFIPPAIVLRYFSAHVASALLANPLAPVEGLTYIVADGYEFPAFEKNLTVDMFIKQWFIRSRVPPEAVPSMQRPHVPISEAAVEVSFWPRPNKISRPDDHQFKTYDIQKIPWWNKLRVRRSDARLIRDTWYKGYRNLEFVPHGYSKRLPQTEDYFKPKTLYTKYKATMTHFQLRNLMSVTSSNTVQYVHRSKVYSVTPFHNQKGCLLDLTNPSKSECFAEAVKISTMKAKHGVTVIGGFNGEYAMRGDVTDYEAEEGRVTKDPNGITNHIDIVKSRASHTPQAVISSNDQYIRILDCVTNKFVHNHRYSRAINCTDTSPDSRLRVIVGDAKEAWIVDSETGKPLQPLAGHQDFGFACAWSPDMLHVATSNQDGTVNVWDARMWRVLQCIESDVAGYRSLRYSPVGGGPRTLLMCEPADRIAIVNAQTYQTRQVHDFFGEIGGADYSPDGGRIWVANMDNQFGGLMEFDRCQWGQEFGMARTRKRLLEERLETYYPDLPNEWLPEGDLDYDGRCVLSSAQRRLRFTRLLGNQEHADLLRI
ncbi:hypothetical protein AJ79_04414 [Helicocarpus griseus UAMH5409]|uniref:Uncharacterized protein n=1 Tax=Helicocarpus griseus UAMH5409 TaxID=1447875 RepID=A0A2B7XKF9_9EURO|nr:hypothetical protein AJ79_04414 [Helicocarpus griseus UAMH5409]